MKRFLVLIPLLFFFTSCFFAPHNQLYDDYENIYKKQIESDIIITNYTKEDLYYCIFENTYVTTTNMDNYLNQNTSNLHYLHSMITTYDDKFIAKYGDTIESEGRVLPLYQDTIYLYKNNVIGDDNLKQGTYRFILYRKQYVKDKYSISKQKKVYIKDTTFNIRENQNITININSNYSLSVY